MDATTVVNEEPRNVPEDLMDLIYHQSVGTKPFTKDEITWLLNIRKFLAIMWECNEECHVQVLISKLDRRTHVLVETDMLQVYVTGESASLDFEGRGEEIGKSPVIADLTGRLDTRIIKDSGFSVSYDEDTDTEVFANVVILDLRSIFVILKKRFESIVPRRVVELARKYTMFAFNNIVDDMQGIKMFALLAYLLANATMLDIDIDAQKYSRFYNIDDSSMNEIRDVCTELYENISITVNNMI